ncbi:hypothetical protein PoB_000044000 [Plakobranchus ocellatus]|uniref:Uncharacterized protein n=1 Tax=Plakobranchus ocellatus TaxID=259542 RepID=A0AAV3XSU1_9GAST|nr:hypothetical protein PoB_000044000 [Plakobranchus ocellatus]
MRSEVTDNERRVTLQAAVHVFNFAGAIMFGNTLISLVQKHTKQVATFIWSKHRNFPGVTSVATLNKGKKSLCHYITKHKSTNRCCTSHEASLVTATSVLQVSHDISRRLQCGPTLTATSVLQVSHDISRRLQCGPTHCDISPSS